MISCPIADQINVGGGSSSVVSSLHLMTHGPGLDGTGGLVVGMGVGGSVWLLKSPQTLHTCNHEDLVLD